MPLPGSPSNQVISQSPPPNASGISAPKISLLITVAAEPPAFLMPNFVGQRLGSVSDQLQQAGMKLGAVTIGSQPAPVNGAASAPTAVSQPSPSSTVVMQNPAAGQKVLAGSAVALEVKP